MEVILLSIVFLIISVFGYITSRKVLNPLFITPFLWGVLLLMYSIVPHSLYNLQEQFLFGISIWVFTFVAGGLFWVKVKGLGSVNFFNPKIFNIYYYIVLIFAPMALVTLVLEAIKSGPELFFFRLRMISTGLDQDDTFSLGVLGYVFNFTNVVCLLFTFYYEKIAKYKYYIVLILAYLLGIITVARTALVTLSIGIFVILYFKGRLKKQHYFYFVGVLLLFMGLMTFLRSLHRTSGESSSIGETLAAYIFASMPAFDTIVYQPETGIGIQTFRFFYAVANSLGFNYEVNKTILEYVYVPIPVNVYTVIQPFYQDFGYTGIAVFGLFYGVLYSFLYKNSVNNNGIYIIIYAFMIPNLLLQFFAEYFLQNLSTFLQYTIYVITPYFLRIKR